MKVSQRQRQTPHAFPPSPPIIKRSDPSARVTLTLFSHARPRFAPPPRELRIEGYTESSCSTHFQAFAKHLSLTTSSRTTTIQSTHLHPTAEPLPIPLYTHTHTPPTTWLTPSFSPTSTASLPGKFFPTIALLSCLCLRSRLDCSNIHPARPRSAASLDNGSRSTCCHAVIIISPAIPRRPPADSINAEPRSSRRTPPSSSLAPLVTSQRRRPSRPCSACTAMPTSPRASRSSAMPAPRWTARST